MKLPKDQLSTAERARLTRFERMQDNRRGRKAPACVPSRLTRTSAFAPKRRGLITDSNFRRLYIVPKHSVIEVSGRELGSQHRDAMYGLFRVPKTRQLSQYHRNSSPKSSSMPTPFEREARTTWRELLTLMGRQPHPNNLLTLLGVFEDIKKVVVTVYEGDPELIVEKLKRGALAGMPGMMGSIVNDIHWGGLELDSEVTITYGSWTISMMKQARLVSHNADVQFELKSDHAKCFWPFIDSQNNHHFIDESMLASLAGRDLWGEGETSATRGQFRKDCRQAFGDMVRAGGLFDWQESVIGTGRNKSRRYAYTHALPRQMELDLDAKAKDKTTQSDSCHTF